MDRLSASGAIAGSKEPWTCRADATPRRRPGNRPGGLRAAGSRAVASARRAAAFPVLCAMLAAPLLGAGGSAQAEELVSNLSDSASSTSMRLGTATGSVDAVQLFTTGTNAGGYTLTSIELSLYRGGGLGTAGIRMPAVKLHAVTVTGTSVTLGTEVATLTTSLPFPGATVETYMAPMGTALGRSTTYGVFVEGGGNGVYWDRAASGDENATPAANWSIGDQAATRAHDATAGFTLGSDGPGMIRVNGEATSGTANTAPTGADKRVETAEDTDYTFSSADFTFTDTDTGDSLASVKIVTLPASGRGTLTLSGTAIPSTDLPKTVPAADLGNLKYSPPANANVGTIGNFVTFDFKVNDGTDDSADTYTMSINVAPMNDPVTGKPGITGTAQVGRTLTATVGTIADVDGLPNPFFSAATTTVQWIQVDGGNESDISGATSETYAVATADEGKKIKVKVSFEDGDGTVEGPLTSDAYPSSGTVIGAVNVAPTGADKTLTIGSDPAYTLTAEDFGFADVNAGDTLHSVRIETLPAAGALALDSAGVSLSDVVTKADIDASKLTFTPTSGASGDSYANFNFKVNDGTVFSDSANTITFNVRDTSCAAPSFGNRRNHWSGVLTVGVLENQGLVVGYGFHDTFNLTSTGSLAPNFFTIGSNSYTIEGAFVGNAVFDLLATGSDGLRLDLASAVTSAEAAALEVHVCDSDGFGFSDTDDPVSALHDYTWQWDGSDWSPPVMTRTLYLSLPANRAATGEPAISGTATAGQVLTATTGTIADADGLPSSFTYQWVRVDADGTSDEEDISGEIAATYTLTTADEGKKVKVKVSFTDNLSGVEMRTSAAYPTSGTVQAGSTPVSTALVSNVEQPGGAHQTLEDNDYAQSFTTGTNATGYTLTSIELRLNSESSTDTPTVKLHSGSANGTEVATLTGPAMLDADTTKNYAFTRTPNVTVRMSTTFAVVVEGDTNWSFALGAGEDATPAAGWVISNDKEFREADSTGSFTVTSGFPFQIRVNGTLGGIVLSSDATLSALALENAADDSAITISPVFAAGTTSYTASVVNGVDEITINPTVNESHATVEYLDSSDTAITDADSGKTGQQVSLTEGANTIKVKVTAEDTTTTNTYTVVVTRAAANNPPTGANKTVTTGEDRPYTFMADDFGFADTDTGDTLASVKIVTPPALGTLALDGTAVLADDVVTKTQIDGNMLTFTPVLNAHGDDYTTFTFKVNDGTVDSAAAYTMTIDVTDAPAPVCTAPSFGDRRQIWTGVVTVEEFSFLGSVTGYGFESPSIGISSLLPSAEFSIGSNTYTIVGISVGNNGHLLFSLPSIRLTATERAALRLNVCDEDLDFSVALNEMDSSIYGWEATFDWSDPVVTRTLYLSLPANNGATGEPTISGTAQAGQVLTADASPILDTDGLTGVDFTYQWVRVDADGMSNPADITDATAATYTLTAADAGKKVKVKVSFTDELSGEEERTSAAYPSSGTVTASTNTTAPTLLSVTVTSTPRKTTDTYGAREHIEFSMTFDAPVTVTGDPTFDFDLGGPSTATWYAGSGTTTLRFSHAVSGGSSGDRDTNGISWAMNAIELNGGTIAGTDNAVTAILTHAAQSNLAGHKVDGRTTAVTPATVTDVVVTSTPMSMASGSTTADTYGFGETIVITVTASEAVEVVGDPEFEFSLTNPGGAANDPPATYDRTRSTATTMVFTYTVQAGDRDNNGIWIGNHSRTFMLDANDRIRTASQQIDIDRSHPEKGTQGGHKVDGSLGAPTVPPDPTAPTLVLATATTLTIEWTHPGNGGSPLTRNFVHYRVEGTTDWTNWYAGETPVTRAVITNLEAATAYDVRVHSSNAIGNSQWAQSATAFSTLGGGTASCPAPTFTGRRKIWTAVLTMGDFTDVDESFRGYEPNPNSGDGGGLDPVTFTLGSRDYEVGRIALVTSGGSGLLFLTEQGRQEGEWWDSTVLALRLHVCNTNFDFSDSEYQYDADDPTVVYSNHLWATDLDWSGVTTRTVHMSLPLNRPATGAPVITGPATVGQELAVDVTGIEDEDGLHDIEYTYQWVRWTPTARRTRGTSPTRPPTPTP